MKSVSTFNSYCREILWNIYYACFSCRLEKFDVRRSSKCKSFELILIKKKIKFDVETRQDVDILYPGCFTVAFTMFQSVRSKISDLLPVISHARSTSCLRVNTRTHVYWYDLLSQNNLHTLFQKVLIDPNRGFVLLPTVKYNPGFLRFTVKFYVIGW